MSEIAIRVENLSKRYRIGAKEETHDTFAEALASIVQGPFRNLKRLRRLTAFSEGNLNHESDIIWALRDVSFELKRGEVIGVIGHNGAGKSTLLKILSRITYPTEGKVELHGRVSSLLEVGTGFHPELTGRENVYLNGTILGMTKVEIDRKFDEIVDFSGVEKFIDTPVKFYSSGMSVRLAFSVAAYLEPEILLIDEVLAVGDAEFQKKCLGKMSGIAGEGRTVLFVSHNMAAIQALCQKAMLIEAGCLQRIDTPQEITTQYLIDIDNDEENGFIKNAIDRQGNGKLRFTNWVVVDEQYGEGYQAGCHHACEFRIKYESELTVKELSNASVSMTIKDILGQPLLTGATLFQNKDFPSIPSSGVFSCHFDALPLVPNAYKVHLWCSIDGETADRVEDVGSFTVVDNDVYGSGKLPQSGKHGFIVTNYTWQCGDS